ELIASVLSSNLTFVAQNFTEAEVAYCQSQPSPVMLFAMCWAGKEATLKGLGIWFKGASVAMKDIEILPEKVGVLCVTLHSDTKIAAIGKNVTTTLTKH
ncbi:hypothetical protein BU17DRAFT_38033, partial [Hysterangium stoloniferum]